MFQCAEVSKTFNYDDGKMKLDSIRLILVIYKMRMRVWYIYLGFEDL